MKHADDKERSERNADAVEMHDFPHFFYRAAYVLSRAFGGLRAYSGVTGYVLSRAFGGLRAYACESFLGALRGPSIKGIPPNHLPPFEGVARYPA